MKEITTPENIKLKEFDIEVIPFLTLKEQQAIVETMLGTPNYLEQQKLLMAGILVTCTSLLDPQVEESIREAENELEEAPETDEKLIQQYTYEDLKYSGLWDAILNECPAINDAINNIWKTVKQFQDIQYTILPTLNSLHKLFQGGEELLETLNKKFKKVKVDKNFINNIVKEIKEK